MAAVVTNTLIEPALELAWAVAKLGSQARPAVPPPGRLRPLMRFAKLPDRALSTVRQVLDEDEGFRTRVVEVAAAAELDRAAWLWLVRPEGWDQDLAALAETAGDAAREVESEKDERRARKRLGVAEAAVARTEAELVDLRRINADLLTEIGGERQSRRQVEDERARLQGDRHAAEVDLARLTQTSVELESRVAELTVRLDQREQQLAVVRQEHDTSEAKLRGARDEVDALTAQLRQPARETPLTGGTGIGAIRPAPDASGVSQLGVALSQAAVAAAELSESLAVAARSVTDRPREAIDSSSITWPPSGVQLRQGSERADGPARTAPKQAQPLGRRSPVVLPPAVFEDSAEAADFLVRVAGVLLVVDGYNVTLSSWPHLDLPRQRRHLVDALAELAMRVGLTVHVVFDGNDAHGRLGPPPGALRSMRLTFSPEGVDADEVIIEIVDQRDPARPVIVATDDRHVRREARSRGANVISVAQLLAVMGRTARGADRGRRAGP